MVFPTIIMIIIVSMSLILHAVERLGIDLDSEESEYDAYVFYQVNVVMMNLLVSHDHDDDHVEDHDADHDHHNELLFHNFASSSQLLEEQTSHMHALVEDIKVTRDLSKVELIMEISCSILTICLPRPFSCLS